MAGPNRGEPDRSARPTRDWSRRTILKRLGVGAFGAGAARVVYELLGFGTVTGTNLTDQPLGEVARRRLEPSPFDLTRSDHRLVFDGESISVEPAGGDEVTTTPAFETDPETTPSVGSATRFEELLGGLAADLRAIESGEYSVGFSGYDAFFDRLRDAQTRPFTVAALRGDRFRRPDPETVRRFTGVDPRDPASLVTGLAEAFRSHTHFDTARYVAGTIQDHVLLDAVPLRRYLREPTGFDALLDSSTGLYCYEYTRRSIEAFHAIAPHRQVVPVFAASVADRRHNHVFTGLASVVREDGALHVPMTFLDYSHATMYDTFHLRGALGDGVDAYDERHRATRIIY